MPRSKEIIPALVEIETSAFVAPLLDVKLRDKLFTITVDEKTAYAQVFAEKDLGGGRVEKAVLAAVDDPERPIRPMVLVLQGEKLVSCYDINLTASDSEDAALFLEKGHVLDMEPEELEQKVLEAIISLGQE